MTSKNNTTKRAMKHYQTNPTFQKRSSQELTMIFSCVALGFAKGVKTRALHDKKSLFAGYKEWLKVQNNGDASNLFGTNVLAAIVLTIGMVWLFPTFATHFHEHILLQGFGSGLSMNLFISELMNGNLLFLTLIPASICFIISGF